jgi:hypothetical protein
MELVNMPLHPFFGYVLSLKSEYFLRCLVLKHRNLDSLHGVRDPCAYETTGKIILSIFESSINIPHSLNLCERVLLYIRSVVLYPVLEDPWFGTSLRQSVLWLQVMRAERGITSRFQAVRNNHVLEARKNLTITFTHTDTKPVSKRDSV